MRQIKAKRKQTFYNILNDIIVQLKSRFENFSELSFLGWIDCSKFSERAQEFDDTKLQSLSERMLNFECNTPAQLLSFLYQNDLIQTVPEATKLLKLVHKVPATTSLVERSQSV